MTTTTTRIYKSQSMSSYFDALKRKYPSQTRSFWANVESTFAHSVQRAKDPSIVLVVSDARTHATADALTNDLFDLYTSLASDVHVPRADLVIDPLEPGGHIQQRPSARRQRMQPRPRRAGYRRETQAHIRHTRRQARTRAQH